jgi:hypothetical protein
MKKHSPQIWQKPSSESSGIMIAQTASVQLAKHEISQTVSDLLALPTDANIHAREYKLYLPSKQLLKKKLLEWTRDQELNA